MPQHVDLVCGGILDVLGVADIKTILVFIVTFLVLYFATRRRSGVPPGPVLWPVIGNLPTLASKDIIGALHEVRQQHGNLFSLYIGTELYVFLNGYDTIHDVLMKRGREFVFRPNSTFYKISANNVGINIANGVHWKLERNFTQMALQEICFKNNGSYIETVINTEAKLLIDRLKKTSKDGTQCIERSDDINVSTMNVIMQLLCKRRFDYDDGIAAHILQTLTEMVQRGTNLLVLCSCFPWIVYLPFDLFGVMDLNQKYSKEAELLRTIVNVPEDNTDDTAPDSYIHMYQRRDFEKIKDQLGRALPKKQMELTSFDLVGAGSETSATVLSWIILYIIKEPHIQEKMFREIMIVVGKDRLPCTDDRPNLPFTQAVVYEGIRLANVTPFGMPRSVSRDVIVQGHVIPQNCHVIVNYDSVLRDPNLWNEPDEFRPERFLDCTEKVVKIPVEFIPFSIGPRACLGQSLAQRELFVFVSSLVQTFQFLPAEDGSAPDMSYHIEITRRPNKFAMRLKDR